MNAKFQSKVLFLAILGTVGVAYADPALPTVTTTHINNTLNNTDTNNVNTGYSTGYHEDISVHEVFDPRLDGLASANVNDIQKNLGNTLNVTDPSTARVNDSVKGITGNAGVNNAAGFFNQQANNVAIASTSATETGKHEYSGGARAAVTFEQMNNGNNFTFAEPMRGTSNDMTASVVDSVKNINGNAGLNNASGAGNQQKNDVALASAGGAILATASAGGMQLNQNTTISSYFPLNVSARVNDSVKNISGNVGVNNAAGLANQQVNALSIAASH